MIVRLLSKSDSLNSFSNPVSIFDFRSSMTDTSLKPSIHVFSLAVKEQYSKVIAHYLRNYPRLQIMARASSDFRNAIATVSNSYQGRKRVSGRFVAEHCLETAEIVSYFTTDPTHLIVGIYHDIVEDLGYSFQDIQEISGKECGKIAKMVVLLSKRKDITDKEERNREYIKRIYTHVSNGKQIVGVIKCADRLSNLSDIQYLPPERRKAIARQTLNFYVPIAFKLGLTTLANRLWILSLPHTSSDVGRRIKT